MSACIPETFIVPNAQQSLTRIRHRLNIGSSLPLALTQSTPQNTLSAAFELSQDLLGNLSNNGARHVNDHASVVDVRILPTAQEITSTRQEHLPLMESTQHHLPGLAGLLDREFRLLREETVGQLRDAVREELTRLEHPYKYDATQIYLSLEEFANTNLDLDNIYLLDDTESARYDSVTQSLLTLRKLSCRGRI